MADKVYAAAGAPAPAANSRAKFWCFTINNPSPCEMHLFPDGIPDSIGYLVYQIEKGEQETTHAQGYVQFKAQTRFNTVKKISFKTTEGADVFPFARAHIEVSRGTPAEASAYYKKTDTRVSGPFEMGKMTEGQGKRTDLAEAATKLMDTGNVRDIDPSLLMKYGSNCFKIAALAVPPYRPNLKVICLEDTTGIGKSFAAHTCYPGCYKPFYGNSGIWFDGYAGEKVLLIEEFKGQVQLQKMLQLLDPYPLRVECKGGSIPARFELIILTTNTPPADWYPDKIGQVTRDPERKALERRLGVGTPRYVKADNRLDLLRGCALAFNLVGVIPPVAGFLPSPMGPYSATPSLAPAPVAAVDPMPVDDYNMDMMAKVHSTPPIDSDDEEPLLKRSDKQDHPSFF